MHSGFARTFQSLLLPLTLATLPTLVAAQEPDPVRWTIAARPGPALAGDTVSLIVTANIDAGFHLYALAQHEEGPYPLTIHAVENEAVKTGGALIAPKPEKIPTSSFGVPVEWYSNRVTFKVPLRLAATASATTVAKVAVRFQSCSNTVCMLPKTIELTQPIVLRARTANRSK